MLKLVLTLLVAPALVGAATLAARRTALPVLASVLTVFTLAQHGGPALQDLLRGMVAGMAAFVVFCALIAALVQPAGIAAAFGVAALGALAAQATAA